MLQTLHDRIKGWIAAVIFGLLCLAFVFWGVQAYVSSEGSAGAALATVGGREVTEKRVNQRYQILQRRARANKLPLTPVLRAQLKALALDQLVSETVLQQAAIKSGFYVGRPQVEQFLLALPQFNRHGHFSPDLFRQTLYGSGLTEAQFFEALRSQMLIAQVASGIESSAFVLPSELKASYALMLERRDFSFLVIPVGRFLQQVKVTEKAEKTYYNNNLAQFQVPERVRLAYVMLSAPAIRAKTSVTDKAVHAYYRENRLNYKNPTRWAIERITLPLPGNADKQAIAAARQKIDALLARLKKGASFESLMREENGVRETVVESSAFSPRFLGQLRQLKPKQVSVPFMTRGGYTLVRLVGVVPGKVKPFQAVKSSIHTLLLNQRVQEKLTAMTDTLANVTYTNPNSLEEAASALDLPVRVSPWFGKQGLKQGIAAAPSVVQAAFSQDVLQAGNNSSPLTLQDGSVVVCRVKGHQPAKVRPFADVKQEVSDLLRRELAEAQAALLGQSVAQALKEKKPLPAAAASALAWREVKGVKRDNTALPRRVVKTAFQLDARAAFSAAAVGLANGDTAVVRLKSVMPGSLKQASIKERRALHKQLTAFWGKLMYQLYVVGAKKEADIQYK